ncbi:MAG TPA: hypothetical protein VFU31_16320 [Candidatus Binatia bacterium]|nr:hypothetical protein [Candidatus Binatia bacterium]
MNLPLIPIVALLLCIAGCSSPENTRTRGSGPGADLGNRGKITRIHEGARPFEKTPKLIPTKHPPLEPASQADQLSRR